MEARYNLTGEDRKRMVSVVSETLGLAAKYQGMPSASYRVGEFTVTKEGGLVWADDYNPIVVECVIDGLARHGFDFVDYTLPRHASELADKLAAMMKAYDDSHDESQADTLTISVPSEGFTPEVFDRLTRLIDSKRTLLQASIGAQNLSITKGEENGVAAISFPWFRYTDDARTIRAYTELVTKLCDMAKTSKRVLGTERPAPNKRFALRIFLVRLGFVGAEYRASRHALIKNLEGSSAWKNGTPPRRNTNVMEVV